MLISWFRTNRPVVLLLLLVYTVLLRLPMILSQTPVAPFHPDSLLGSVVFDALTQSGIPLMYLHLADAFLVFLQAIFFNFLLVNNSIFDRHTYVPAAIYTTISGLLGPWMAADLQTIGQICLLLSTFNLFSLSVNDLRREHIFYTALYLSLGSMFYFPVSYFFIILLAGLLIRSFALMDILLLAVGMILPYFFTGLWYYYQDRLPEYLKGLLKVFYPKPDFNLASYPNAGELGMVAFVLLLVFIGFVLFQRDREFRILKQRRMVMLMLVYLVLTILLTPLVSASKTLYLQLIVIPSSIFAARFFDQEHPRMYHHIAFLLLLGGVVFFELFTLEIL